jgi:hypothetical protein
VKERIAEFELEATVAGLGLSGNLLMGLEGREADAEVQRARIEAAVPWGSKC